MRRKKQEDQQHQPPQPPRTTTFPRPRRPQPQPRRRAQQLQSLQQPQQQLQLSQQRKATQEKSRPRRTTEMKINEEDFKTKLSLSLSHTFVQNPTAAKQSTWKDHSPWPYNTTDRQKHNYGVQWIPSLSAMANNRTQYLKQNTVINLSCTVTLENWVGYWISKMPIFHRKYLLQSSETSGLNMF